MKLPGFGTEIQRCLFGYYSMRAKEYTQQCYRAHSVHKCVSNKILKYEEPLAVEAKANWMAHEKDAARRPDVKT